MNLIHHAYLTSFLISIAGLMNILTYCYEFCIACGSLAWYRWSLLTIHKGNSGYTSVYEVTTHSKRNVRTYMHVHMHAYTHTHTYKITHTFLWTWIIWDSQPRYQSCYVNTGCKHTQGTPLPGIPTHTLTPLHADP